MKIRRSVIRTRRGYALALAMVALICLSLLSASIMRGSFRIRRESRHHHWQRQAELVADAAIRRAVARYNQEENYQGESWTIPADQLNRAGAAQSQIEIHEGSGTVVFHTITRYPIERRRTFAVERSLELPISGTKP